MQETYNFNAFVSGKATATHEGLKIVRPQRPFPPHRGQAIRDPLEKPGEVTWEEHLQVQRAIEQRARELWQSDDYNSSHRLDHWLQAESEVLSDFLRLRVTPA